MNYGFVEAGVIAMAAALIAGEAIERPREDVLAAFSPARRAEIEAGSAVVVTDKAVGFDVGIIGAVKTTADTRRLVAWFREVEQLERGRYIPVIQRFSSPPRIEDLAALELDEDDLEELRDCRPGHCDLKLSAAEMARIREAMRGAGYGWQRAAQDAFRCMLLERARVYLSEGLAGAPPYDDKKTPLMLLSEFEQLLTAWRVEGLRIAPVAEYLKQYPRERNDRIESLLFWSKDALGDMKPIVGITHVAIAHGADSQEPTIIASTQVYASHYVTASLSITAVTDTPDGATRYLFYARRSNGDLFDGPFGGLVRRIVQRRVRAEGPGVLEALRQRIEAGPPRPLFTEPAPLR